MIQLIIWLGLACGSKYDDKADEMLLQLKSVLESIVPATTDEFHSNHIFAGKL